MGETRFRPQDFGIGRLFEHIRDAVLVANASTEQIVLWNEAATHIFGYSREEALGLLLHALVPEDLRDQHRAGLARYQSTGTGELIDGPTDVVELRGLHKDGHEFPLELTLTAVPEASPEGHRFAVAIVRDITDRKLAEESRQYEREARARHEHGLQLHDAIVQGLAVAKYALDLELGDKASAAIEETLEKARRIVTSLVDEANIQGISPSEYLKRNARKE